MKICALSDLHGHLPEVPECDVVCIAGDLSPMYEQTRSGVAMAPWFLKNFADWLNSLKCEKIIGIAGNHDFIAQNSNLFMHGLTGLAPKWVYLEDETYEHRGFKFHGTPWQPPFYDWAFNLPEEELRKKFDLIPHDLDVLISHGPPLGYGDLTTRGQNAGSRELLKACAEKKPKHLICGHIHPARGEYEAGPVTVHNCSVVDERCKLVHEPVTITLEEKETA